MHHSLYPYSVDHADKAVVLSMRGTLSIADSMLDLLADTVPYAGGVAHKGVARCVCRCITLSIILYVYCVGVSSVSIGNDTSTKRCFQW
jgi:hypothetical protein